MKTAPKKRLRQIKKNRMLEAVSIVVVKGRSAYLGTRLKRNDNYGKRCCPGGKVEKGESRVESARRELRQETGFHAEDILPLGTLRLENPDFGVYDCHGFVVTVPQHVTLLNLEPAKNKGWQAIPVACLLKMREEILLPGTKQFVWAAASKLGLI